MRAVALHFGRVDRRLPYRVALPSITNKKSAAERQTARVGRAYWGGYNGEQNLSRWRRLFSPSSDASATAQAAEPKHGGILQIYHRETPPSLSIHEEATFSVNAPGDGHVQQPGHLRSAQAANQHRHDRAGAGDQLGLGQGEHRAHLQAAAGRQMARRRAVHRQGREMHLRPAAGQGAGQVPQESAQGLVRNSSPTSPSTATTR